MKTAIAIRHVSFENLGNLAPVLVKHGYCIECKDAGFDSLVGIPAAVDLLIVLGGPIGAYEEAVYPFLRDELSLLEKRLEQDLPTLGICLGAQLMARALGARVYRGHEKEIGWKPVGLTTQASASPLIAIEGVPVLHWHGDTFDLPEGALLLAGTQAYRHQAFRWGRRGLALQFHAEVEAATLERWFIGHACEIGMLKEKSVPSLRAETAQFAPHLQAPATKLWERWLSTLD